MVDRFEYSPEARDQMGPLAATETAAGFTSILTAIESLHTDMTTRFEMEEKIAESRFASMGEVMESRFASMEEVMEGRFASMEKEISALQDRVSTVANRQWFMMGTVLLSALGIIAGAGAMIYTALQLLS